ncbi:MAG: ABC transporter permease [Pseudonocardiales bacterium]|nr:ABC transporter permease [Pseudonocardiales bacterium]MBV9032698.1 ABC transporter permease [Pseudonocardiales bacterium]MBW0011028.1 ABC transporter permease [Pseudonocardiales bacterium]
MTASRTTASGTTSGREERSTPASGPVRAPLGRLLRSELRWVLRRPRTQIALGLLALVPVLIGIGIAVAGSPGGGLLTQIAGNGLVLPVAALSISLTLLLPLAVTMAAADALAGESAHGTLRGLLLAPVSRTRLVLVKAVGVLTVAVSAVAAVTVLGIITGLALLGPSGSTHGLLTLSGTEIGPGSALVRVSLAATWTVGQLAAVGAVALAVSSATEHPLVVLAAVLGALIVFGVLSAIPALDWLQPVLLTTGWFAIVDVLRDPLPLDGLATSSLRAGCYLLIGLGLTLARTATREA